MQDPIEQLKDVLVLDPDEEIWSDGPPAFATGEPLTRRQLRQILINEMNGIKQERNAKTFADHQKRRNEYFTYHRELGEFLRGKREQKPKSVTYPIDPVYTPTFSKRGINEAVHMARQRGGYGEILRDCGF